MWSHRHSYRNVKPAAPTATQNVVDAQLTAYTFCAVPVVLASQLAPPLLLWAITPWSPTSTQLRPRQSTPFAGFKTANDENGAGDGVHVDPLSVSRLTSTLLVTATQCVGGAARHSVHDAELGLHVAPAQAAVTRGQHRLVITDSLTMVCLGTAHPGQRHRDTRVPQGPRLPGVLGEECGAGISDCRAMGRVGTGDAVEKVLRGNRHSRPCESSVPAHEDEATGSAHGDALGRTGARNGVECRGHTRC